MTNMWINIALTCFILFGLWMLGGIAWMAVCMVWRESRQRRERARREKLEDKRVRPCRHFPKYLAIRAPTCDCIPCHDKWRLLRSQRVS